MLRANIVGEIKDNLAKLYDVVGYHEMLRDSSRYYLNQTKPVQPPTFFRGVRTASLTKSAFETGIQTGLINGFTFEKIRKINNLYTRQDNYANMTNLLFSGLIDVTMNTDDSNAGIRKVLQFLAISMTDISIQEAGIVEEYEALLSELERQ